MEANTLRFGLVVFLFSTIAVLASADTGYEKSRPGPYMSPKPATPKVEHATYPKADTPKVPTKLVIPKVSEKNYPKLPSKPMVPIKEDVKNYPKLPTKPVVPKKGDEKNYPKLPTKPVVPKKGDEKNNPKLPTKSLVPKKEQYEKNYPELPTKPVVPKKEEGGYQKIDPKLPTKPVVVPKAEHEGYGKTYPKVPEHPKNIAVQGLVYCKYGAKLLPLHGATARVTCLAVHKNGYESAPFSFSSRPADEKGYFLAKIPSSKLVKDDLWEIVECKAFLEKSPWTSCKNPEDTNGGISGAHLTFSRHLNGNGYCLSSVGPFIYNSGHESSPKEGY